jgi:hypothetical protein
VDVKPSESETNSLSPGDCLDRIRMSPDQRRMARASMRQAELIVDMLMRANDDLRRIFGFIGHGIGAVARRGKLVPAAPEWRSP